MRILVFKYDLGTDVTSYSSDSKRKRMGRRIMWVSKTTFEYKYFAKLELNFFFAKQTEWKNGNAVVIINWKVNIKE